MAVDIHQPTNGDSVTVAVEKSIARAPQWVWVMLPILLVFVCCWVSFLLYWAVVWRNAFSAQALIGIALFAAGLVTNPQSLIRRIG